MSAATAEPTDPARTTDHGDHVRRDRRGRVASVALVGAGPRGTSVLERLCASAPELLAPGTRLTVHVVDPSPPGPGRVWRTAQPAELLMNTVASQVTLFTDDSVDCSGPIRPGPSLHTWADGELGPDDYPTRAQYGQYLEWVFAEVVRGAPPALRVETHRARATRLDDTADGHQILVLDNGRTLPDLSAVVLAQGHLPAVADRAQQRLAAYADRHGLRHVPPANPADLDLSCVAPGETVLLRGLGLNFFDHMALLTTARGGRFRRTAAGLRYLPSGREPHLRAGSRRGIPYQARGDNAKGPYGRHVPLVLTPDVISRFRKRADSGDAPDFLTEIWPLVAKEVETVYYEGLLGRAALLSTLTDTGPGAVRPPGGFRERFLAVPHRDPQEAPVLDEFGIRRPTAGPGTDFAAVRRSGLHRPRRLPGVAAGPPPRGRRAGRARQRRRSPQGGSRRTARPAQRVAADRRPRRARAEPRAGTTWTAGTPRSTRSSRSARPGAVSRRWPH